MKKLFLNFASLLHLSYFIPQRYKRFKYTAPNLKYGFCFILVAHNYNLIKVTLFSNFSLKNLLAVVTHPLDTPRSAKIDS